MDFSIPEAIHSLRPIFVLAPSARNGITLMQRLLNSTRKIIVYGEDGYFMQYIPDAISSSFADLQKFEETNRMVREVFLKQTTEFWTSNLQVDGIHYLQVRLNHLFDIALYYQQFSESCGFDRWGIKQPLANPVPFELLLQLFRNAQIIFLYRNLFDVARSAKARKWMNSRDDCINLANQWQQNLVPILGANFDRTLILRYESFIADPDPHIDRIEKFTGLEGIDRTVMSLKINTFAGEKEGESLNMYVPPAELKKKKKSLLEQHAAKALELIARSN